MTAQLTVGDDEGTVDRLVTAVRALADRIDEMPVAKPVDLPAPGELELERVMPPRDAFFGRTEDVEVRRAAGRIAAETVSP